MKGGGGGFEHFRVKGREGSVVRFQSGQDLNFVSKRRVPNGPDPIHNRLQESVHGTHIDTSFSNLIDFIATSEESREVWATTWTSIAAASGGEGLLKETSTIGGGKNYA
ncbi:CLAVATA3/ESR (CLE)-related protein 25 [Acorus calamus]|uniref:CLAVATA3/ESR (CLE)-related protein 25 n=1 Tax=Acorus calamus TaxID=4465 RepID=A0AAV9CJB9_ACOCL|nr:CLAVATA3/ESR (CLE)-related protein 25 [Acorus calamus]